MDTLGGIRNEMRLVLAEISLPQQTKTQLCHCYHLRCARLSPIIERRRYMHVGEKLSTTTAAAHHHVTIIVNFMKIPSHMSITTFFLSATRLFGLSRELLFATEAKSESYLQHPTSFSRLSTQSFRPLSTIEWWRAASRMWERESRRKVC